MSKCIGGTDNCEYAEYVNTEGGVVEVKSLEVSADGSGSSSVGAVRRKATTASANTLSKAYSGDLVSALISDKANPSVSTGESNDLESIFVMIV